MFLNQKKGNDFYIYDFDLFSLIIQSKVHSHIILSPNVLFISFIALTRIYSFILTGCSSLHPTLHSELPGIRIHVCFVLGSYPSNMGQKYV